MELKKILLVEDDVAFNFLNKIFFKSNNINCQIDIALQGEEAMDYIKRTEECPDVIFLDINMPVMDGIEFLKKYDEQQKCCDHTKIFMLTSSTSDEEKEKSLSYPFVKGFLDKPLTESHLKRVLEVVEAG